MAPAALCHGASRFIRPAPQVGRPQRETATADPSIRYEFADQDSRKNHASRITGYGSHKRQLDRRQDFRIIIQTAD